MSQPLSLSQSCVPGAASGSRDASWMLVLRMGTWWGASSCPRPGLRSTGSHFPSKTTSPRPLCPSCIGCGCGPVSIPLESLLVQAAVFSGVGLLGALPFSVWSVSRRQWGGLGLKHAEHNCQSFGSQWGQEKATGDCVVSNQRWLGDLGTGPL